jgi:hypothetical protein
LFSDGLADRPAEADVPGVAPLPAPPLVPDDAQQPTTAPTDKARMSPRMRFIRILHVEGK